MFRIRLPSVHVVLPVATQVWLVGSSPEFIYGHCSYVIGRVRGGCRYCSLPASGSQSDHCRDIGCPLSHHFSAEEPVPENENLRVSVPSRFSAVLNSDFILISYFSYTHHMFSHRNVRNTHNYVLKIDLTSLDSR